MIGSDCGLRAYTARLLAGTGLDPAAAAAVAAGEPAQVPPAGVVAAAALADGWRAAGRAFPADATTAEGSRAGVRP